MSSVIEEMVVSALPTVGLNSSDSTNDVGGGRQCKDVNCGEGGCHLSRRTGRPICRCLQGTSSALDPDDWPKPDEFNRCHHTGQHPLPAAATAVFSGYGENESGRAQRSTTTTTPETPGVSRPLMSPRPLPLSRDLAMRRLSDVAHRNEYSKTASVTATVSLPPGQDHVTAARAAAITIAVICGFLLVSLALLLLVVVRRRSRCQQAQAWKRSSGQLQGVSGIRGFDMDQPHVSQTGGTTWLFAEERQQHSAAAAAAAASYGVQGVSRGPLLERLTTVMTRNDNYCMDRNSGLLFDRLTLGSLPILPAGLQRLMLLEAVGEGAFGKVYKGLLTREEDGSSAFVAVKMLKDDASLEVREDLLREVRIMSSFEHDNILRLIGVVPLDGQTPCMVFEYMAHGDLTSVLRYNDPNFHPASTVPSTVTEPDAKPEIKQNDLVRIAVQIANGMKYLASKHFVHRDLATRNCLVDNSLAVKISDFGMTRDVYTCDYYKVGGCRMLPVRWMSVESVLHGKYTTESDVWAFGVVLWEIYTYGRQPYYGHSNEEVIKFIEEGILLQKPSGCSDTLYHVMLGCWRRDPAERFTFERIYRHLMDYEQNEQNRKP